ncbi:MAG: SIS domain-containing protein [Anaerolineae bacterium]|nr:SIS domain-containing protein [Anaerolineae bacterium]MDW8172765.1 SIS domain-containing protein [Anaerolineae bacterium]
MSERSPLHQQIDTLPDLVRQVAQPFDESARAVFDFELCTSVKRIVLVGCGDSHHASYGAELAFMQLAGIPTQAFSSLTFSRYQVGYLPNTGPNTNVVIAVSVSGVVSRTIEALDLAQKVGAVGVALTGNPQGPLGNLAHKVFQTTVPPLADEMRGTVVPGVRSYLASQTALYHAALRIGEVRGHLTTAQADALRRELRELADLMESTIRACEPVARQIVANWPDWTEVVFVGAGPLYGSAMFSAAKVLEASGDGAIAQETEEWTHLQYFAEPAQTPTFLLDCDGFSSDRMAELARAAQSIGRQVVAIVPQGESTISAFAQHIMPVVGQVRECFASLVYSIPGELIAAERAQALGSAYFRDFSGGRTVDWARDGASRIRDSHMQTEVKR